MSRARLSMPAAAVLAWAIASVAAVVAALAALGVDRTPTAAAGPANLKALWPYWVASASGWASLTVLWRLLARGGIGSAGGWAAVAVVAVVATGARIATLVTHEPALSDDIHRYVLDGRSLAGGLNPYLLTPGEHLAAGAATGEETALLRRVNNPELHTIYLPASQWTFAAVAALSPRSGPATRPFRCAFVLLELAAIGVLLAALMRSGRSPWWAALYAWHPLSLSEIAGSGHQDAIGLLLLAAALLAAGTGATRGVGWVARWTVPLALAALVKPLVLPVAAFVLRGRRLADWLASAAIGAAVSLAVAAPLLLTHGGEPVANLMATVERFRLKWAHFGSVYEPLLWIIERLAPEWGNDNQEVLARWLCLAVVAGVILWIWRRVLDRWAAARMTFVAMVLLSPAAHPWYLLWALMMVPMAPGAVTWVASLTLPWGYAVLGDVVGWSVSPWVMIAAYAPVYAALAVRVLRRRAEYPVAP